MLTTLQKKMIILFMILYTTVAALINGTSPLTSTMNLLGYEPIKSVNSTHLNSTALKTAVRSLVKSSVKKKSPDIPPKQLNYVTKNITSCPDVGYFFKRELQNSVDASQCYLCFCSDPKWAICWPRENKRCDNEHFHRHGVGKRDVRTRRSPGFSDIFFRDAKLDIFNRNTPEQCKPYESSFSEGCPPADWCIGCTVCDCDSNGRWDCHTLSFCPDQEAKNDKNKKQKEKRSDKHLRRNKKKVYKERLSKNAKSSHKNIGKVKSKTTKKRSSESKTATISEKKMMQRNKKPQLDQPAKRKFKKKDKYEISENTSMKKNTTHVVKNLTKKKRDVKKNIKNTAIVSKRDKKNNITALTKNASKKNNTITKNKPKRIKSEKSIPPKNKQTKNKNVIKKSKSVRKEINPKKITKANLRQSLKKKPARSQISVTKKTMAKKVNASVNAKNSKGSLKESITNTKKIQTIEKRKTQKSGNNNKKTLKDHKNKNSKDKKNNDQAKTENFQKSLNTADLIRQVEAKIKELQSGKKSKKKIGDGNRIEYNFPEGIDNRNRVKRHVYSTASTKFINNENNTITENLINMKTITKPVIGMKIDKINPVNSTTFKPFTISDKHMNETVGDSIFDSKNLNLVNTLTDKIVAENKTTDITEKISMQINKTVFSANPTGIMFETTTSMDVEPTVSLSSYYMYSIDELVKTTPELNKTRTFSAKRSLSDIANLKNLTYTTKNTDFKTVGLGRSTTFTTEPLNGNELIKILAQQNPATLKYTEKTKDLEKRHRSDDMESVKSEPNRRLQSVNFTVQDLKEKKRKIYSSELTRKLGSTDKKYRLKKILHVYNRNRTRLNELYGTNSSKKKKTTNERLSSLQNFIRNQISLLNKRNFTKKFGAQNLKVISYLRKFFKKILTSQNEGKILLQNETSLTINKSKFFKTLCETFGPCYITQQKQLLLNARINDLSSETNKMFKTIKVLKGLLKLLNFGKNNKNQNISNEDKDAFNFNTDIRKLGSILRDNYVEEQKGNLTTTQLNQINYIKRNMQFFAQSTASFAKILNEIINVLTTPGNTTGLLEKYPKGLKTKSEKQVETFKTLKNLLISYKLLQNRFLQKMHEILGQIYPLQPSLTAIADDKANKTANLNVYTKNIIKNLRKLKKIAQVALSKTTTHPRKRRDLRDEESMEYLLVLMEYLLKQSYQKDPVTDGIDLLIEAIKNAPDIKLIKKQVLQKHLQAYNVTTTQMGQNELFNNATNNKISKIKNYASEYNNISKQDDSQVNNIDSMDNESDFDYLSVMNRRVNDDTTLRTEVNDDKTYYKEQTTEDTSILELSSAKPQTESSFILSLQSSSLKTILLDGYNNKLDKVMNGGEDDEFEKRINIFNSDLDDETLTTPLSTKQRHKIKSNKVVTEKYIEISQGMTETDLEDNLKTDLKDDMPLSTSESKNVKYLDWLDETFEEEIKEVNDTEKVKPLLQNMPTHEIVLRRPHDKDYSLSDETCVTKKRDLDSEDKIYNKEINLLNSLDNNFEKSESGGLDSKDTFELHNETD